MNILKNGLLLLLLMAFFVGVNMEVPISTDDVTFAKITLTGTECDDDDNGNNNGGGKGVPEPSLIMIIVLGAGGAIAWRFFRKKK